MADGEAKAIYGPLDEDLEAEIERLKRAVDYQNKYIEELETIRERGCDEMACLRTALEEVLKWREVLTEENQRLRSALEAICDTYMSDGENYTEAEIMYERAKKALEDE